MESDLQAADRSPGTLREIQVGSLTNEEWADFIWGALWRGLCASLASGALGFGCGIVVGIVSNLLLSIAGVPEAVRLTLQTLLGALLGSGIGVLLLSQYLKWLLRMRVGMMRFALVAGGRGAVVAKGVGRHRSYGTLCLVLFCTLASFVATAGILAYSTKGVRSGGGAQAGVASSDADHAPLAPSPAAVPKTVLDFIRKSLSSDRTAFVQGIRTGAEKGLKHAMPTASIHEVLEPLVADLGTSIRAGVRLTADIPLEGQATLAPALYEMRQYFHAGGVVNVELWCFTAMSECKEVPGLLSGIEERLLPALASDALSEIMPDGGKCEVGSETQHLGVQVRRASCWYEPGTNAVINRLTNEEAIAMFRLAAGSPESKATR